MSRRIKTTAQARKARAKAEWRLFLRKNYDPREPAEALLIEQHGVPEEDALAFLYAVMLDKPVDMPTDEVMWYYKLWKGQRNERTTDSAG